MAKSVFQDRLKAELALRKKILSQKNSLLAFSGSPFRRWKNTVLSCFLKKTVNARWAKKRSPTRYLK